MTRLLPISFLLLFFVSCKPYEIAGVQERLASVNSIQNPYFLDTTMDYVYKAHIEVYGNDLSGIFVVKKISDNKHRVVLTTDFGNKLLDFEFSETDFKVNYIVADLDKKIIINTLKNDFKLLLQKEFVVGRMFENDSLVVYQSKKKK
jgi:hypothetical protein